MNAPSWKRRFASRFEPSQRGTTLGGVAALACFATHAAFHVAHGRWYDSFWACHMAALFVGLGLLAQSATTNGVGVLLGLLGLPLWLSDLAAGGPFYPTSLLTHGAAPAIGLCGVARWGMPRGTWWKAAAALLALIGISRFATPEAANVNVAFHIQPGWEDYFSSHASYLAITLAAAAVYCLVVERLLRDVFRDRSDASIKPPVSLRR